MTEPETGRPKRHVYLLPGLCRLEEYAAVLDEPLLLTEEAELHIGTPAGKVLKDRGNISDELMGKILGKLWDVVDVLAVRRWERLLKITAAEYTRWQFICSKLVAIVAEVYGIPEEDVILHDLTSDTELNLYVIGGPSTNVRYFAATSRPLTATEVQELERRHKFSPDRSQSVVLMEANLGSILGGIRETEHVAAVQFVSKLLRVTSESAGDWASLPQLIAQVVADCIYIHLEDVRIHDLSTAA